MEPDEGQEISEERAVQIHCERLEEVEIQIEQDEYPPQPEIDEPPKRRKLRRELRDEALTRLEDSARTLDDFQQIIREWDKLDANRERRERYHEVLRSGDDVPLDYGAAQSGQHFPADSALTWQIQLGDFLDAIFYCPFEIHELVADAGISAILEGLTNDQKELLFLWAVRLYSAPRIAAIRGQSDRNIRKVRNTMLKQIHTKLLPVLLAKRQVGRPLTMEEKVFLSGYEKTALDGGKDG